MPKILIAQYHRRADAQGTLDAVLEDLSRKVTATASFVVLPENALSSPAAGPLPCALRDQALERLADVATRHHTYVLTGSWADEAVSHGGLENVVHLLDPAGEIVVTLRRPIDEKGRTGTGIDFPVLDTEHGRVGVLLGPDFWLIEPPRIQCLAGAEMLLVAGSTSSTQTDSQHAAVWGIATLNTVGVAIASALDAPSAGGSGIAVPEGFLAWAGTQECVVSAEWDLEHIRHLRQPDLRFQETLWFGLWARRPDLYRSLLTEVPLAAVSNGSGG